MGVEGVVIACNTASASALPELTGALFDSHLGVIDPGVEAAAGLTRNRCVGVIGTQGTISSGAYQRRQEQLGSFVWARACAMLVHIVEEGLANWPECDLVLRHYLKNPLLMMHAAAPEPHPSCAPDRGCVEPQSRPHGRFPCRAPNLPPPAHAGYPSAGQPVHKDREPAYGA